MSQQDAGSDMMLACGTQVCDKTQVCCLKKIAPFASCIAPADFAAEQCETPPGQPSCFTPADCQPGEVCCLNENTFSIACLSSVMCPGNGQSGTYLACGTPLDCPNPSTATCTDVPGTGDAGVLKYCSPFAP
jgi:hypothetical protein